MSLPKNSQWLIERNIDGPKDTPDQKIQVTGNNEETFTANCVLQGRKSARCADG